MLKRFDTSAGEPTRQLVESFIAGGTITAGDVVKFDTSQSDDDRALYCVIGVADGLAFGIALNSATSGQRVYVVVKGYVEDATTDGSVAITNSLCSDANGDCTKYAGTETYQPFAVALETDTGTAADIYVWGLAS